MQKFAQIEKIYQEYDQDLEEFLDELEDQDMAITSEFREGIENAKDALEVELKIEEVDY